VEVIRYRVHPSRREEFERAHEAAADALSGVVECRELEVAAAMEGPERYDVRIIWVFTERDCAWDRLDLFPTFRGEAQLVGYDMYNLRS
jgi:hypothetical protein